MFLFDSELNNEEYKEKYKIETVEVYMILLMKMVRIFEIFISR